ncbi:MAG: hypothetical protein AVDCRST_MAG96-2240 [uncultured Segetibacter sp.]|uniref:Outer membrane protein beta-barrel domain-containing protein n=1 Tax=uncultured Segetibacter sp. TaxID=481133 RepID=A0A6J4SVF9_9BACT|nr:MAG: hypothetical protein AVDCRST_MAG96-2240 [uncultured Segetibacter sp.]
MLIVLLELWHSAKSQGHVGAEQYYYKDEGQAFTFVPIIYYETSKNWYVEGRYNYEASNTISVYAGKTFEKRSALSFSASPVIGAVMGGFNGGSVGVNSEADYKRCFFSSQLQYTFSLENKKSNFIYSWSDLSYQALNNIYAGFSVQQTNVYREQCKLEKGIFVRASFNKWTIPLYLFSPSTKERYFVLGLNCDW